MDEQLLQWLQKAERFCSYRDRCTSEVEDKLRRLEVPREKWELILKELRSTQMLDDERFVASYVSGKFRNNQWGVRKIVAGLRAKRISEELIQEAVQHLNEDEIRTTIEKLAIRKGLEPGLDYGAKQRIIRYLSGKGFEPSLIFQVIDQYGK